MEIFVKCLVRLPFAHFLKNWVIFIISFFFKSLDTGSVSLLITSRKSIILELVSVDCIFFFLSMGHIFLFLTVSQSHSVMSNFLWPHWLYSPWNSLGQNTGMGSFSRLQRTFPTQGSNPGLPHCRWILYQLSHKGSPSFLLSGLLWNPGYYD